jgi:glycosyltransferase involved in cell wall biosynthesis
VSPEGGWVSWDLHPWKHPWLTNKNLRRIKEFSSEFLEREKRALERIDPKTLRIGFCGNIANCMYVRAVPLRKAGLDVSIFIHPDDTYAMSHPGWEEYDGECAEGDLSLAALRDKNIVLPQVEQTYSLPKVAEWRAIYEGSGARFLRSQDAAEFKSYLSIMPTLLALQDMDVLWGTQVPYFAYLANRPYVVSQMGGDFWFDASRDDELGALVRRSFSQARINLVSNPWVFAHARRYGMKNLVYLPKIIDQTVYSPGRGPLRNEWVTKTGGDFFVLTSSRLDNRNKGSSIGLKGFATFTRQFPGARLVLFGWGKDRKLLEQSLVKLGIAERTLVLPVSGKERMRDALRSADVFIDQFVVGYFGSAGMEAMACGLPMIGRLERDQYEALCETGAPPVLHAENRTDVARHLERLYIEPNSRRTLADETRRWFVDNHGSDRWLAEHQAVLASTALSMPADFTKSPLAARLSLRERAYHGNGLRNAPKYPNYGY